LTTIAVTISPGISEQISADGLRVFAHAWRLGAEGIVSKRLGSPYRSGPHAAWVKVRNPASVAVQRERSEKWNKLNGVDGQPDGRVALFLSA
jgi:ATP-dependent DNA ligase